MMNDRLLNALMGIGFTQNSAKVYSVLLEDAPLSGYAIARRSGVTRSRTYDALERLLAKGCVCTVPGEPVKYMPVDIETITARQEAEEQENILRARAALSQIQCQDPTPDNLLCLTGYRMIMQSILSDIETAKEKISISVKKEEYVILEPALRAAAKRGVRICAVWAVENQADITGDFTADAVYVDRFHTGQARAGNRWVVVSVDGASGLIGLVSRGQQSVAVSTRNPPYVALIAANIASYFVQRDYVELEGASPFHSFETSAYAKLRKELASL